MREIFKAFSCKSWIILREETFDSVLETLSLTKVRDDLSWEQALEIGVEQIKTNNEVETLIFTSPTNGYVIIEGSNLEKKGSIISEKISNGHDFVFNMTIDIWIPYMFVEVFSEGKLIRRIEYDLDVDQNKVDILEVGDKTKWEYKIDYLPESPIGYDDFFYPLYFVNSLGIDMPQIEDLFNQKAIILKCKTRTDP